MQQERLKIFISAVTSEFGKVRDALAADLRARGHLVRVQSDFTQSADSETLLGRLAEYIRDCHAVICIVGKQCGACPPPRAVERLPGVLPTSAGLLTDMGKSQAEIESACAELMRPLAGMASAPATAGEGDRPKGGGGGVGGSSK